MSPASRSRRLALSSNGRSCDRPAFELASFPSLRSWLSYGWQVFLVSVAASPRAGGFSEFAGLRAAFRAPRGGFSELLRRRARVSGFQRQVSLVAVANCLHAGSGTRKTCQQNPISVHSDSESRKTRQQSLRLCRYRAASILLMREFVHAIASATSEIKPSPGSWSA